MKNKQLIEVSYDELASDKTSKFFFHGLTGKEFKKIRKPTPRNPFFITDKLLIASSYSSGLIYILRLNETKYFNFKKYSDWMKLCNNPYLAKLFRFEPDDSLMDISTEVYLCLLEIRKNKSLMEKIKNQKIFNEYLELLSKDLPEDFYENKKYNDLQDIFELNSTKIIVFSFWLLQFYRKEFINGNFYLGSNDVEQRRSIKEMLFKIILDKTDYKIVGELDTDGGVYSSIVEFAILDLSVIKDIYPYPVKTEESFKILNQLKKSRK